MIYVDSQCDNCTRRKAPARKWWPTCEAFPEGIPAEWYGNHDTSVCNNGVGYAPDREDEKTIKANEVR